MSVSTIWYGSRWPNSSWLCLCATVFVIEISVGFSKPCKADVLLSGCGLYLVSRQFEWIKQMTSPKEGGHLLAQLFLNWAILVPCLYK